MQDKDGFQIQANLVTSKTVDNNTPQVGDTIVYTIDVSNSGPAQATSITLTDKLPAGITYVSHTGGIYTSNSGLWDIGTLDNGATVTLNITATVNVGESGSTITNMTTPASTPDQNDVTIDGDDLNESITVVGSPDLMISNARIIEGGELVFDVNLSSTVHFDTVVTLTQKDVTTTPSDRSNTPVNVTIPANTISVPVTITALPDEIVENTETFKLKGEITSPVGQGKTAEGTGTILDDDVNTQTLTIDDVTAAEEEEEILFTVSIGNPSSEDTVITLNLEDVTTSPEDHGDVPVTVTIPAGATSVTTAIPVTNDDIAERDETFTLQGEITSTLGNGKTAEGTGTITDDDIGDLVPYVSDASLPEPTGADENMTFVVTLSHEVSEDTTIAMSIEDGQTTDTDRGTASPVSFTILAGERNATVYVPIHPDALAESDETFNLIATITSALGKDAQGGGAGTIEEVNPDEAFSISNESAKEGEDENLTFEVTLTQVSTVDTTIVLSLTDVTTDGDDHGDLTPISVTIPAGETTTYVNVPVTEDFVREENPSVETLSIDGEITEGLDAAVGKTAEGLGSISDGVIPDGWLNIDDVKVNESAGTMTFTVSVDRPYYVDSEVKLELRDVTAEKGADYVELNVTSITIPANATEVTVTVGITEDLILEEDETFELYAEVTSSAYLGQNDTGTGTIVDNDGAGLTLTIDDVTAAEEEEEILFTVSIGNPSSEDTVITLNLEDVTTSPEDHGAVAETVTIPAGATSVAVAIPVTNDDIAERDETFTLQGEITSTLGNGKTAEGTGTITDDDISDLVPYVSDASLPEPTGADDENMTFVITLSHEVSEDTTIAMSIEDGQTTDTDRGAPSPVSFTILAGERNATVYVPIHPDALAESDETFNLIATITSALGKDAQGGGAGTIEEVNPDEAFSISNESAKEGEDENLTFEVTLTQVSTVDTTIVLSLTDVTTDGDDHGDLTPISVTIPAGETTTYVNVPVTEDFVREENPSVETLSIDGEITEGLDAAVGKTAEGLGSISDGVIPDGWLNIDDVKVNESAGTMTFTVSVDRPYYADSEVKLELRDVTAEKGADYVELNVTSITIPANASEVTVTVGITEDLILEADETFELYAEVTSSAYLGQNDTGTGTIVDNDKTIIIIDDNGGSPSGDGVVEGQFLIFDINLSLPSSEDIVVELSTTDGTATAPEDYITTTQTITIEAGETHATFEVATVDDEEDEADRETIIISAKIISGIDGNPITLATGIIRDNDVMTEDDIITSDDPHVPASVNVLENDANNSNPTTVDLKPSDDAPVGTSANDTDGDGDVDEIVVPGEGIWSVDDNGTVTFTPETGFTGDPTSITYTVEDDQGNVSEPATIEADYPQTPTDVEDDSATGEVGIPTTVNVLDNDTDNEDDTNVSSVNLIVPENADANATDRDGDGDIDSIIVPGEGTWTVDDNGIVTFTSEDGFTGDPTPITYTVGDNTGEISEPALINIDIKQELRDDNVTGVIHKPRVIHILDNDDATIDSSTVSLSGSDDATAIDTDGDGDIDEIIVPGEGVWNDVLPIFQTSSPKDYAAV